MSGIAVGDGNGNLNLNNVINSAVVKVGDLFETTGMGGVYPRGLPVGRVLRIESQQAVSRVVLIPLATISSDDVVLLYPSQGELHDA